MYAPSCVGHSEIVVMSLLHNTVFVGLAPSEYTVSVSVLESLRDGVVIAEAQLNRTNEKATRLNIQIVIVTVQTNKEEVAIDN